MANDIGAKGRDGLGTAAIMAAGSAMMAVDIGSGSHQVPASTHLTAVAEALLVCIVPLSAVVRKMASHPMLRAHPNPEIEAWRRRNVARGAIALSVLALAATAAQVCWAMLHRGMNLDEVRRLTMVAAATGLPVATATAMIAARTVRWRLIGSHRWLAAAVLATLIPAATYEDMAAGRVAADMHFALENDGAGRLALPTIEPSDDVVKTAMMVLRSYKIQLSLLAARGMRPADVHDASAYMEWIMGGRRCGDGGDGKRVCPMRAEPIPATTRDRLQTLFMPWSVPEGDSANERSVDDILRDDPPPMRGGA